MKPLSAVYYSINNKRKLISMIICIGFSIALIYSLQFFIAEIKESVDQTLLNPLKEYSEVYSNSEEPIPENVVNDIMQNQYTEKVIPLLRQQTFFYPVVGKYPVSVFSLNVKDMGYLMKQLGLSLAQGRLPEDNKEEAVIDSHLAKNKGLKIGDRIGYDVDEKEQDMKGSYQIVGFIEGSSMLILLPRTDNLSNEELYPRGMLVFHKDGKLTESDNYLESLYKDTSISTYQIVSNARSKDMKDIKRYINILVFMLITVLSISMGNASYIHTFERRHEYALLYSVGYSPVRILIKAISEIFFIYMLGCLLGLFVTLLLAGIIYFGLFEPNGLTIRLFLPDAFLQSLIIPVFVTLFSIIPVSRMLKKIDSISIIEGE